jgi:hypothetical protein
MTVKTYDPASTTVTFVYSPDDGGWYAEEFCFATERSRVTRKIYDTEGSCRRAVDWAPALRSVWEGWS